MKKKRYVRTQYVGIRKCTNTGHFQAKIKLPNEERPRTKTFRKISEAISWRKTVASEPLVDKVAGSGISFGELWDKYVSEKLKYQSYGTQENRLELSKAFKPLLAVSVSAIDSVQISRLLEIWKEKALVDNNPRRQSFENELKLLKTIFNWYREMYEPRFVNPVSKNHLKNSRIRAKKVKCKKMNEEEVSRLLEAFKGDNEFWYDFFVVHLLCACRVSEVAALQPKSIMLASNEIMIDKGVTWSKKNKRFYELSGTKTGDYKISKLTTELRDILKRRMSLMPKGCEFIFHKEGQPLSYRQIQYRYNKALKRAGLSDRFSATHFARHTMATLVRNETGSLDDTMAITGHKCRKVASLYADYSNERGFGAVEQISGRILADFGDESVPECAFVQ